MATRVNSASITGNAVTSPVTITIPSGTGIQAGDLIIVAGESHGVASPVITVQDSVNLVSFTQTAQVLAAASSTKRYLTGFWFQTPQAIADLSTVTLTLAGAVSQLGGAIDIFRGCSGAVDQAAVSSGNIASGNSAAAPALAANAAAGALVITQMCAGSTGTFTAGSPFSTGSNDTNVTDAANGYVLSASGSSTYASTWTWTGTASTSGNLTVSFAAAAGATPAPLVVPQAAVMQAVNW